LRLARCSVSGLPKTEKTWRKYNKKAIEEHGLSVISEKKYIIDEEGNKKEYSVKLFSIWSFIKKTFEKKHHAQILGNWREQQQPKGTMLIFR
jgi:hypothetical protein